MKSTTVVALILGSQLAIFHIIATKLSLYWEISWFDNAMHLFGGITLIFLLFALMDVRILKPSMLSKWRMAILVMMVLLGWEAIGVFMMGLFKENFMADTLTDILFGILGSIAGWFIGRVIKKI